MKCNKNRCNKRPKRYGYYGDTPLDYCYKHLDILITFLKGFKYSHQVGHETRINKNYRVAKKILKEIEEEVNQHGK